jgi:hypothetical protein
MRIGGMTIRTLTMAAAATVVFASQAFAFVVVSPITYGVNLTVGNGTVTGDIVTDGNTSSSFSANDITNWNLLLTEPGFSADLTGSNSFNIELGTDLSATSSLTLRRVRREVANIEHRPLFLRLGVRCDLLAALSTKPF